MRRRGRGKAFTMGALLGGIAAGMTALLFAPKSGKKMRAELKNRYYDLGEKSQDFCDDMKERSKTFAKETKKAAKRFVKK